MKRTLLFFLLINSSLNSQVDSSIVINLKADKINFEKAMSINDATAEQIDSMVYLSINYSYSSKDSCLLLGYHSVKLGENIEERSVYANALLELGDSYRIYGDFEKADRLLNLGTELYKELGDKGQIAYASNKLGALYINKGDNEGALKHYLMALRSWEEIKDSQNIFKPNLNIAWVFYRLNQLDKAQQYNDKAYEIAEALNDDRQLGMALNNRGIFLSAISKEFSAKADTIPERAVELKDSADYYQSQVFITHEQSLAIAKKLEDNRAVMRSLVNICDLHNNMGNYKAALSLGLEAESMSKSLGDLRLNIMNKRSLSKSYRNLGMYSKSIEYGEAALDLAKENNMQAFIAAANNELHKSYKAAGQYQKALSVLETINEYIQETNEENTTKAIADAEARYQNIKKENELLDKRNEILELENKNAVYQRQRNTILGSTFLFAVAAFFLLRMKRLRKERNDKKEFAEALLYAQEEERKRIAQDLHDGIGQTLLIIKKQMDSTQNTSLENQKLIGETLEEVRSISRDLHPFQLEKFGLLNSLKDMIVKFSKATDIFFSHEIDAMDDILSDKKELAVYRVIQEAINNIVKHSGATAAKLELKHKAGMINCRILDNGIGLNVEESYGSGSSLGLKTMKERIVSLGGRFSILENKPKGTIVEFSLAV